jgi:hypothetical protein
MNDTSHPSSTSEKPPVSKLAIASLVTGILSMFLCVGGFLGFVAIALGSAARSQISRSGTPLRGGGFARAGTITGSIGVILALAIVGLYFWQKNATLQISKLGEAEKTLFAQTGGKAGFGNTPEAVSLAEKLAASMELSAASMPDKPTGLSIEGDKFLVYAWLTDHSAAFLVTVPNLRKYSDESRKKLIATAWTNAQQAMQQAGASSSLKLAVATRGALAYDNIWSGKAAIGTTQDKEITERELERFFR